MTLTRSLALALALFPLMVGAAAAQTYTTENGCSYTRAQVPGYPATWHLILNPQQAGLPLPEGTCPHML